jgi:hypothetical protein
MGTKGSGRPKRSGLIDIPIGTGFGSRIVIGPAEQRSQHSRVYYYLCRCKCGTETHVTGTGLRKGTSPSCVSCAAVARGASGDITGRHYGQWTVIAFINAPERRSAGYPWLCRCKCGREKTMTVNELQRAELAGAGCQKCWDGPPFKLRPYESIFNAAKGSAKHRRLDFTISFEEFLSCVETGRCHYCWAPIEWPIFMGSDRGQAHHMDRKDSLFGYVTGNVVACCQQCNYAKRHDYTYEQWYAMNECYRNGTVLR